MGVRAVDLITVVFVRATSTISNPGKICGAISLYAALRTHRVSNLFAGRKTKARNAKPIRHNIAHNARVGNAFSPSVSSQKIVIAGH